MLGYLYRMAVSKPDEEKKQFHVQQDLIQVEKKLTQNDIDLMSKENKADVYVIYLGELKMPLEEDLTNIASNYYTKKQLDNYKLKWAQPKEVQ